MCHVACCLQSHLFGPISGRFTPIRAANPHSDAAGATHSLRPQKPGAWSQVAGWSCGSAPTQRQSIASGRKPLVGDEVHRSLRPAPTGRQSYGHCRPVPRCLLPETDKSGSRQGLRTTFSCVFEGF